MPSDPASPLIQKAAILRSELPRLKEAFQPYLRVSEERPDVADVLLRSYLAARQLIELIHPSRPAHAGFADAFDLPDEVFGPEPHLEFVGKEGWDFYPWLHEKVVRIEKALQRLAETWFLDPKSVTLRPDAPMSPREWIRDGVGGALSEIEHNATKVFDLLFSDEIAVVEKVRRPEPRNQKQNGKTIPSLLPLDSDRPEILKIGLAGGAWSSSEEDWRLGSFPDSLDRIESALSGNSEAVRVLNVQVKHGADVVVKEGIVDALLWLRWSPVSWDIGDEGIREPGSSELEAAMSAWAATRPSLDLLSDMGEAVIAVTYRLTSTVTSLAGLMEALNKASDKLRHNASAERRLYEGEFQKQLHAYRDASAG